MRNNVNFIVVYPFVVIEFERFYKTTEKFKFYTIAISIQFVNAFGRKDYKCSLTLTRHTVQLYMASNRI